MLKSRTMLFSVIAAAILLSLSSATASAQQFPSDVVTRYANKPCSNPYVSWALWSRSEGFSPGSSGTSADCNTNNYGTWSTAAQLLLKVDTYHFQKKLSAKGILYNGSFIGRDGKKYFVFGKDDAIVGIQIDSGVVGTAGGSFISNDGGTLVSTNGGNVIAQGGGNLVPGATVIAQGGGNLISANSGKVIAQGGGNLKQGTGIGYLGQSTGSTLTLFQFPNRYAVVSGAPAPAPQPPRPATQPPPAVRTDEQIQLCTNSSSSVLAQIRRADGGANHITFYITSGTAYFSGNVLTQYYKDQLTNAARTCGARNVSNNLRLGR